MPRGLMMVKRVREIVFRYGVPPEFVCKLSGDSEYIFYSSPIEVTMSEETF